MLDRLESALAPAWACTRVEHWERLGATLSIEQPRVLILDPSLDDWAALDARHLRPTPDGPRLAAFRGWHGRRTILCAPPDTRSATAATYLAQWTMVRVMPRDQHATTDAWTALLARTVEDRLGQLVWQTTRARAHTGPGYVPLAVQRALLDAGTGWTAEALARDVGVTRRALDRALERGGWPGAHELIHLGRLAAALTRLLDVEEPVSCTAQALGYARVRGLGEAVDRLLGVRPGAVREVPEAQIVTHLVHALGGPGAERVPQAAPGDAGRSRVLLVDSATPAGTALSQCLQHHGLGVVRTTSAERATLLAREGPWAAVVIDAGLVDGSALALMALLTADPALRSRTVLVGVPREGLPSLGVVLPAGWHPDEVARLVHCLRVPGVGEGRPEVA